MAINGTTLTGGTCTLLYNFSQAARYNCSANGYTTFHDYYAYSFLKQLYLTSTGNNYTGYVYYSTPNTAAPTKIYNFNVTNTS